MGRRSRKLEREWVTERYGMEPFDWSEGEAVGGEEGKESRLESLPLKAFWTEPALAEWAGWAAERIKEESEKRALAERRDKAWAEDGKSVLEAAWDEGRYLERLREGSLNLQKEWKNGLPAGSLSGASRLVEPAAWAFSPESLCSLADAYSWGKVEREPFWSHSALLRGVLGLSEKCFRWLANFGGWRGELPGWACLSKEAAEERLGSSETWESLERFWGAEAPLDKSFAANWASAVWEFFGERRSPSDGEAGFLLECAAVALANQESMFGREAVRV